MLDVFRLKRTVGPAHQVDPDDVAITKTALADLGHYAIPDFGITPHVDRALFDGLKDFQRQQGLKADGLMKPDGPTAARLDALLADRRGRPLLPAAKDSTGPTAGDPRARPDGTEMIPALRHIDDTNTTQDDPHQKMEIPVINKEKARIQAIIDDRPARFEIRPNSEADGSWRRHEDPTLGSEAVTKYDPIIREMAEKHGVDPDLIRAVMWAENARGHKFGINALADLTRRSDSPLPMNMNKETGAKLLGKRPEDLYDARDNIEAATIFLKRIRDRIDAPHPTPAQIGSIWLFTGREKTHDFGEFIQRVYDEKLWEKPVGEAEVYF